MAFRDCRDCQSFVYLDNGNRLEDRKGNPVKRPPKSPPPCRYGKGRGCPKGTPENSAALSDKNAKAYWHYLQCKAVGSFPDDPIVRNNATLIRSIEDAAAQDRAANLALLSVQSRK